jgi:hypothetical protein
LAQKRQPGRSSELNYVSAEALAEEREQLEATLVAMGVDLSAFPTLATRPGCGTA